MGGRGVITLNAHTVESNVIASIDIQNNPVLDGYEVVRFGKVRDNEYYLNAAADAVEKARPGQFKQRGRDNAPWRLIVKKTYKWPDWIAPGAWIAMNANGTWLVYASRPNMGSNGWVNMHMTLSAKFIENSPVLTLRDAFVPPQVDSWKESLMQKPVKA